MIYNLEKILPKEVIENGVYESLTAPRKGDGIIGYLDKIVEEIKNCPFIHCPDYDLLVLISDELMVTDSDGLTMSAPQFIHIICSHWWIDVNK